MNQRILIGLSLLSFAGACSDDGPDSNASESANSGPVGESPTGADGDEGDASCDDRFLEGEALVESLQACETDADCRVSSEIVPCVTPCYLPISKDAEQSDLNDALAWADAYIEDRCPCAIGDCVAPSMVSAACSGNRCQIVANTGAN
jgi:hypothetical protein